MGCPDIWLSIILGVSVRVFLGQSDTEITRAEQTALPDVGGLVQLAEGPNKTEELPEREPCLPGGPQPGTPCFPASGTQMEAWALPGCQFSQHRDGKYSISFHGSSEVAGLQLTSCRSSDWSASIAVRARSLCNR